MTRDDILRMAREAGFVLASNATGEAMGRFSRFAVLAAAAEREECAQLVETEWSTDAEKAYGDELAAAIRARSNQ